MNSVYKFRLQTGKEQKMMKQGRLGYNSSNGRYGLLASDLWIDTGFHCGEGLEVLVDDENGKKSEYLPRIYYEDAEYISRIVDDVIDRKTEAFNAVSITGPKGCGKIIVNDVNRT